MIGLGYHELGWSISGGGAAQARTRRRVLVVELRAGDAVGVGEAAPLPGMSIDTIDDARDALDRISANEIDGYVLAGDPDGRTVLARINGALDRFAVRSPSARFAVETAILDLVGRKRGVSVAALLADEPAAALPCAAVVDTAAEARAWVASGARTLKIKLGHDVRAIAAAAPGVRLRIDANRAWSPDDARRELAALADLPIDFVEEPCADSLALLGASPVPLALDESLAALDDATIDRALPSLAALVLKPTLLGLARCLDLAARARARGVAVVVTHALEGAIGTAACAEVARAIGTAAAGLAPHPAIARSHFDAPAQIAGAHVVAAWRPGLGLEGGLDGLLRRDTENALSLQQAWRDRDGTAIVTARDELSFRRCFDSLAETRASAIVATPTVETIHAIHAALQQRQPLALLHAKLAPAELDRQRAHVEAAALPPDTAFVLFTSGSTGEPRGVCLSRRAVVAAARASALGWRDDDRWLLALSTAHTGGLAIVVRCLVARRAIVLAGDDLAADLERATLASLVPTQLAALLDDPAWRPPPQLRAVLLGGAAAPASLVDAALARGVPVLATYGMTETFGQIATAREPGGPLVPLPGVELASRGGRLHARGPMLATAYLDGAPIAPDFATPDLGTVDGGILRITGRADDVIITGGENVHPAEVEAALAATPGVRAAVAFGVPDARWGQLVAAAIAVEPGFELAPALARWAALPSHARPRLLAIRDALPLLPTGKLDRRAAAQLPTEPVGYDSRS